MSDEKSAMPKSDASMLADNGILYRSPSQLSSTVARTYKNEYAQRSEYSTGAPVIFEFNSGTSYVDPQLALLSFDLQISNANVAPLTLTWGGGLGACNLFSELRIISKNGVEIDRTQECGLLAKVLSDYTMSKESRASLEMCDGYATTYDGVATGFVVPAAGSVTVPITIPMTVLSGFFRPIVKGMYIPSGLAAGLRLEMQLEEADRAFTTETAGAADGNITYKILNPQMLLMLSDLNDPTQNSLFSQSASTGLEYNFPSYFSSKVSNGTSNRINEQLKKSVSQANRAFAVVLDRSDANYESLLHSGYNSAPASRISAFNWRLGSQFYPLERLTRVPNYWAIANACFNELRDLEWKPNQVNFSKFVNGSAIAAASLDMSDHINLSGSKINNSSVLELRLDITNGGDDPVDVVLFLQFTSETKTSGSRSILKI